MFVSFQHPANARLRFSARVNLDYEVLECSLVTIQPEGEEQREKLEPGRGGELPAERLREVGFDPVEIGFLIEEAVDAKREREEGSAL